MQHLIRSITDKNQNIPTFTFIKDLEKNGKKNSFPLSNYLVMILYYSFLIDKISLKVFVKVVCIIENF